MPHQYFEDNTNLPSNIQKITFSIKGKKLDFLTDNGVFSKTSIDLGSRNLLKYAIINDAKTILDVGCGYGTIGLSIAKLYPNTKVDMVDISERALDLARQNKSINTIENAEIFASDSYQNITKNYDMIITNPPIRAGKKIVNDIVIGGGSHLNENGNLWCVIQKKHGAQSLIKAMKEVYTSVEVVNVVDEYCIIKAQK